jgi:hypothetical protein
MLSAFQERATEPSTKKDVSYFHPNTDKDYANGVAIALDSHPDIHAYLADVLPPTHPNVQKMLANPTAFPLPEDWHPKLSTFQHRSAKPIVQREVSFYHPGLDASFAAGVAIDLRTHPDLEVTFAAVLPATHPPVMSLLADPASNPLPEGGWHPMLSTFTHRQHEPTLQREVSAYHPDIDVSYGAGIAINLASHPDLQETFAAVLPPTHPPVNTLLANPKQHPMPTDFNHPLLSKFQRRANVPNVDVPVSFYHP